MRGGVRAKCIAVLAAAVVGVSASAQGQGAPPNLYQWLAANPVLSGLQPTRNFQWYWGCAAGLPGACQYIAVGRTNPANDYLELRYNYGFMYTPSGVQYAMYDYWSGVAPDPNCQGGGGNSTMIPISCAAWNAWLTSTICRPDWSDPK